LRWCWLNLRFGLSRGFRLQINAKLYLVTPIKSIAFLTLFNHSRKRKTKVNFSTVDVPNLKTPRQKLHNLFLHDSLLYFTEYSGFKMTMLNQNTQNPIVRKALKQALEILEEFSLDPDFSIKAGIAFGNSFDVTKLESIRQQFKYRNFGTFPEIEIRPAADINYANGVFAATTNTIYLANEYVSLNSNNSKTIANVLLEEIGHFIDNQINIADTPGDEGAIFAALTQGIQLDKPTLQALKAEDDSATVILNGQVIQIEQNSLSGIPTTDVPRVLDLSLIIAAAVAANPSIGITAAVINAILGIDESTAGWVWVDPSQKYKSVTGTVTESFVTHTDFPANHDSHDQNTHIKVDPEYDNLLSVINDPGEIEVEWETGILPYEHGGDGANPIFPKWVWPSAGDRVWVEGNWIYDAGHPDDFKRYRSEIHPPRAFATMRDRVMSMPDTGSVPVHVTATDLYIHGNGGYATEVLNNANLIVDGGHSTRTSPIDVDFDFDILLPPKPSDTAIFTYSITEGAGNTVNIAPVLTPELANNKVRVHVPLAGSGISPTEVYARHINVGWAYPTTDLRHLRVTLTKMILHEDMDLDPGDGELTFSWLNIDKAGSNAWQRLSDFDIPTRAYGGVFGIGAYDNTLEDYDDDAGIGNGELNFSGPTYDFYVTNGQPVSIRAHAYDQDGFDDLFGNHSPFILQLPAYIEAITLEGGDNDQYNVLETFLKASDYRVGEFSVSNPDNQYEMFFRVEEVPLKETEINKSPIANANGPYIVPEGENIKLSSAGSSDPDGSLHDLQWDLNYDGIKFNIDDTNPSPTFSAIELDGSSSQTIALRVIDNLGVPTIAKSTVNITNVAPTALVKGDTFGVPGLTRSFTFSATDPSKVDTAAGFDFNIRYGDGTKQESKSKDPFTLTHIYTAEGKNTVTATASDKDGGISEVATHLIEIKAAGILPDLIDPTKTALYVGGTLGDDQISVTQQGATGIYNVLLNGQSKGNFSPNARIVIYGQAGNDDINVPNSSLPVEIHAGIGNDYLTGGLSSLSMFGDIGDDTYYVDSTSDIVTEFLDQGNQDLVNSAINYILGSNLENLNLLEGTAALNGTGNELSNIINGNSASNIIDGGAGSDYLFGFAGSDTINGGDGDDWIFGGLGNDILTGGSGNDAFAFNSITDAGDRITDFTVGSDKIVLKEVVNSSGFRSSNFLADGFFSVRAVGSSMTAVMIDPDGAAAGLFRPVPFLLLNNVSATALNNSSNFTFV
jgi:RTX calcium-binding nonapeptide repeat (4 copies)/PKD domain